jgi:hypothetical protein
MASVISVWHKDAMRELLQSLKKVLLEGDKANKKVILKKATDRAKELLEANGDNLVVVDIVDVGSFAKVCLCVCLSVYLSVSVPVLVSDIHLYVLH